MDQGLIAKRYSCTRTRRAKQPSIRGPRFQSSTGWSGMCIGEGSHGEGWHLRRDDPFFFHVLVVPDASWAHSFTFARRGCRLGEIRKSRSQASKAWPLQLALGIYSACLGEERPTSCFLFFCDKWSTVNPGRGPEALVQPDEASADTSFAGTNRGA